MGLLRVTVVGIIPAAFKGADLSAADAWVPLNVFTGGRLIRAAALGMRTAAAIISRSSPVGHSSQRGGLCPAAAAVAVQQIETQRTGKPDASKLLLGPIIEASRSRGGGQRAEPVYPNRRRRADLARRRLRERGHAPSRPGNAPTPRYRRSLCAWRFPNPAVRATARRVPAARHTRRTRCARSRYPGAPCSSGIFSFPASTGLAA